jgi:energy-coupling factor transport system ATP-binding protein
MGEVTADDPARRAEPGSVGGAGAQAPPESSDSTESDPVKALRGFRHELRGALLPSELAEAAVLGDLGLVLEVLGWFVPLVGAAFQGMAIVPFAALAARQRARASVVAMLATSSVSFLVGGIGIVVQTAIAGTIGLAVGVAYRRRWNPAAAVVIAMVTTGIPLAAISLVAQALSPGLRRLAFAQVQIVWRDLRRVLELAGLKSLSTAGDRAVRWIIRDWWLSVPVFEFVAVVLAAGLCARYLWPLLVRLEADQPLPGEVVAGRDRGARKERFGGVPAARAPVPVELDKVSYQYPGSFAWAVAEVSISVEPGAFLALVGPNGSGKSTLVRLIAGRLSPTLGTVRRAGDPGFGQPGGTSMIFQRPESQVLGVRARDDVVWGLPPTPRPDVAGLLARVGLTGFADRETSGLSGGELQRLAIAACLAREPKLLISDEATAMIDGPGRAEVVALLESLASAGITVVHVTHRQAEAARADKTLLMYGGRLAPPPLARPATTSARPDAAPPAPPAAPPPGGAETPGRAVTTSAAATRAPEWARPRPRPLLRVRELGYVYAKGTPWARRALESVDLDLLRGEGLVVTGDNGSGKSTLAWILAGLLVPTEGEALLGGESVVAGTGAVGISFQHARLQLIRPTVLSDVAYGADKDRAAAALRSVGLDPVNMGPRRVDELSGGEQRRVALAGLLVRDPVLLVLDEPYAGLDDEARAGLAAILARLRDERGMATLVVSHDLDNAELLGDRLVILQAGRVVGEREVESGR